MNNQSNTNSSKLFTYLRGILIGVSVFVAIMLIGALAIHKEIVGISFVPIFSAFSVFVSVFIGSLLTAGDSGSLVSSLMVAFAFIGLLFLLGIVIYGGKTALRSSLPVILSALAAVVCAVLIKASIGGRHVRKKH
ncbi:MAG: hypothetical protein IJE90_00030 [Clostridia bacterium]|nr:hypothetical protein [Clostridia bacterium]